MCAQPSETSEVIEALEESQMTLGGMASNRYAAPFRESVAAWLGRLGVVGEQLESWLAVQALWMYMEAVFSGGDIVKQLPAEAKRFQNIDKNFMKVRLPTPSLGFQCSEECDQLQAQRRSVTCICTRHRSWLSHSACASRLRR